jgi:transposase
MTRLETTAPTITRWRDRYAETGIPGLLHDGSRPGRKPALSDATVRGIVELTLRERPPHATHWSTRSMAEATGVSAATVYRVWKAHGLQPHRVETFKLSRDPAFVPKLRDVVGL